MESFIYEVCSICREELTEIEDIMVDKDTDDYICADCAYAIDNVKCRGHFEDLEKECKEVEDLFEDYPGLRDIVEMRRNIY